MAKRKAVSAGRKVEARVREVLRPIGVVRSTLVSRKNAPRQPDEGAPEAVVEIVPEVAEGLVGLKTGDEVIVITWLHQGNRKTLQVHPRQDLARPLAGVFATRSPDRPNPIGLHRVKIVAMEGLKIRLGSIEAIDGTPVVDLKPVRGGGWDG